jgi:hypothetical protein
VTAANDYDYDADILETLSKRVMVGDGAMGTQLQDADLSLDDFNNRRRRGRDEIRSAAIWLTLSGREALQRFRVPAGIRHARQIQGRLPLRKECM